jgi:hypothetical protein
MVLSPLSARGLVHEGSEVLVPVQEVAVHAGPADDSPPADPPVFSSEVGDCVQHGCTLGGRSFRRASARREIRCS